MPEKRYEEDEEPGQFQASRPGSGEEGIRRGRRKPQRRRDYDEYDDEYDDEEDDRFRRPDLSERLIPYKNPKALLAYYLGVFSLIPIVALVLGPAALILGIKGYQYSRKYPSAAGGGHSITGIVLGALTTLANWGVVLSVIGWVLVGRK